MNYAYLIYQIKDPIQKKIIRDKEGMMKIRGRFFKELDTYYVFPEDGRMAILYPDGGHTILSVGDNLAYGGKFTQEMLKEGLSRCIGTADFSLGNPSSSWGKADIT